jgi:hypothetical protein
MNSCNITPQICCLPHVDAPMYQPIPTDTKQSGCGTLVPNTLTGHCNAAQGSWMHSQVTWAMQCYKRPTISPPTAGCGRIKGAMKRIGFRACKCKAMRFLPHRPAPVPGYSIASTADYVQVGPSWLPVAVRVSHLLLPSPLLSSPPRCIHVSSTTQ